MLQIWMEILYFGRLQEVLGLRAQKDQQVMLLEQRLKKFRETPQTEQTWHGAQSELSLTEY